MRSNPRVDDVRTDLVKGNGYLVVSRYGWKVLEIEGKKYLTAMTKKEYDKVIYNAEQKGNINIASGTCYPNNRLQCLKGSCTGHCEPYYDSDIQAWACQCEG
jgi:hypothetical protein